MWIAHKNLWVSVLAAALVAGCGSSAGPPAEANAAATSAPARPSIDPARIAAAQRALAAEPKVRRAVYEAPRWRVSVVDDGTRRDGYAEYVCLVLREQRATDSATEVNVLDQADDGQLGYARCPA